MGISLDWLVSGFLFMGGLMQLRRFMKRLTKWNRLKKRCTQKTQGVIDQEVELSGSRGNGGQRVTFIYDAGEKHFTQMSDFLYKRHTFQWGQRVTVCYDPSEPKSCYLEENNGQVRFEMAVNILSGIFLCMLSVLGIISQIV